LPRPVGRRRGVAAADADRSAPPRRASPRRLALAMEGPRATAVLDLRRRRNRRPRPPAVLDALPQADGPTLPAPGAMDDPPQGRTVLEAQSAIDDPASSVSCRSGVRLPSEGNRED